MRARMKRLGGVVCCLGLSLAAGGCLMAGGTQTQVSGTRIPSESLQQVEAGKTNRAWLVKVFGKPTAVKELDDGVEILEYRFTETKTFGFHLFLLIAFADSKATHETAYFQLRDGVVEKYWVAKA